MKGLFKPHSCTCFCFNICFSLMSLEAWLFDLLTIVYFLLLTLSVSQWFFVGLWACELQFCLSPKANGFSFLNKLLTFLMTFIRGCSLNVYLYWSILALLESSSYFIWELKPGNYSWNNTKHDSEFCSCPTHMYRSMYRCSASCSFLVRLTP